MNQRTQIVRILQYMKIHIGLSFLLSIIGYVIHFVIVTLPNYNLNVVINLYMYIIIGLVQ